MNKYICILYIISIIKNNIDMNEEDIELFYTISQKAKNDKNNKKREIIIEKIINDDICNYLLNNKYWNNIYYSIKKYFYSMSSNNIIRMKCIRKGGRKSCFNKKN